MASTIIPVGDPKAAIRWSAALSLDINHTGFFSNRFVGKGKSFCIEEKTELEADQGDTIRFDLLVNLVEEPVFGDNKVEGTAESMKHRSDAIMIDQIRHPVSGGGRMTKKRTIHNLRRDAKTLLKEYWAKFKDEMTFMYLSGARGINEDFIMRQGFNGMSVNPFRAPDAAHHAFGGAATSVASLTAADKMSRDVIEKVETRARMMRAKDRTKANMQPININGGKHYVMVMSPYQEHDMRTDIGENGWVRIQRDAAGAEGRNNPIFKGGMGMVKNVVLHSHENVIRFDNGGAGGDVEYNRALFLGAQAAVCAHGTADKRKYMWHETTEDAGNETVITAGCIWGIQKSQFDGSDFGSCTVDTAATDPNG